MHSYPQKILKGAHADQSLVSRPGDDADMQRLSFRVNKKDPSDVG
jgi:hypothetical protein